MLICLNEFAAAARIRKLAGKMYVMISRPLPAAYRRLRAPQPINPYIHQFDKFGQSVGRQEGVFEKGMTSQGGRS